MPTHIQIVQVLFHPAGKLFTCKWKGKSQLHVGNWVVMSVQDNDYSTGLVIAYGGEDDDTTPHIIARGEEPSDWPNLVSRKQVSDPPGSCFACTNQATRHCTIGCDPEQRIQPVCDWCFGTWSCCAEHVLVRVSYQESPREQT